MKQFVFCLLETNETVRYGVISALSASDAYERLGGARINGIKASAVSEIKYPEFQIDSLGDDEGWF